LNIRQELSASTNTYFCWRFLSASTDRLVLVGTTSMLAVVEMATQIPQCPPAEIIIVVIRFEFSKISASFQN
jgi:hypothetical protein